MTGHAIKSLKFLIAGGMLAATILSATGSAMALEVYRSYEAGCARWESQGAGERTKCFDCLERRHMGGRTVWINTCEHPPY